MITVSRYLLVVVLCAFINKSTSAQLATNVPVSLSANSGNMVSRAPDSRGWTDPALNHNKLLQQQTSEGMYKMIGIYKVVGSAYLFGGHNKADMFSTEAKAYNIFISYNTYSQEVEFNSTSNPNTPLIKEPGDIDSFIIQSNVELGIIAPLKFIYGTLIGSNEKSYYHELYAGKKYSVYKRYKSELGIVSTNYVQSDLRQFDLNYDYYYTDNVKKSIKKLKANASNVIKEFKGSKDLASVATNEAFSANPDAALKKTFDYLNN
jgi:hypothetical protein